MVIKKEKIAQMKVKQMTFMIIAVTILLAMVGLFFLKFRLGVMVEQATELEEENAKLLVSKLANSPEFSCGDAFGSEKSNCVDFDKIMMLKENINKYDGFWGIDSIELMFVYAFNTRTDREFECTSENYPDCNYVKIVEDQDPTGIFVGSFVTVCKKQILDPNKPAQNVCNLGKLLVKYKDKKLGSE